MHDRPARSMRATRIAAAIAFCLAAILAPVAAAPPAEASTHGAGERDEVGHWHGAYIENGASAYCLNYHLDWDGGAAPVWAGAVTAYGSLSAAQLGAIGAVVAAFGQTSDPAEARAVADAIWYVTDGVAPWGATAPRSWQLIAWMAAWVAAPASGTLAMAIELDEPGGRDAILTVGELSVGASVTGVIRLEHAVFVDTGADTMVGEFAPGQSHAIRGAPPTGAAYRMAAAFTGTATLAVSASAVPLYGYGDGYQTMAGPPGAAVVPIAGTAEAAEASDAVRLTTRTDARVPVGSSIRDVAELDDLGAGIDLAGWSLGFELFEFADPGVAECTPATRVFSSGRVPVSGAGTWESDPFPSERAGTFGWVATLYDPGGVSQAAGTCGDPAETVVVEPVLAVTGDASGTVALTLGVGLSLAGAGFVTAAARTRDRGAASRATPPGRARSARGRRG